MMNRIQGVLRWVEVLVWMSLILYLSGESFVASHTLVAMEYWVAFFNIPISGENLVLIQAGLRKGAHFGEFFVLGLLLYRALSGDLVNFRLKTAIWVLVIGLLCAIGDEFGQLFSTSRAPSLGDSALDFAGLVASQLCIVIRSDTAAVEALSRGPGSPVPPRRF